MNLFDGKYKTRPSINLAGSSKQKTKDDLIKQAVLERRRREIEKLELASALKIQSCYRSYLIRKRIKEDLRRLFDRLLDTNSTDYRLILAALVKCYDARSPADQDRLLRLSQLALQNKELILESFHRQQMYADSFSLTLAKLLVLQLRLLNKRTKFTHSVILRCIDFYTAHESHARYGDRQLDGSSSKLNIMFNFLIKSGLVRELLAFAVTHIPASVQDGTSVPIAVSIAELILRSFAFQSRTSVAANRCIVEALCTQLFAFADVPQVRHVLKCLCELIARANVAHIPHIVAFVRSYTPLLFEQQQNQQNHKQSATRTPTNDDATDNSYLIVHCIVKLFSNVLDFLTNEQFNDYLSLLRLLMTQAAPPLSRRRRQQQRHLKSQQLLASAATIGSNEVSLVSSSSSSSSKSDYLDELIGNLESRVFAAKIESLLHSQFTSNPSTGNSPNVIKATGSSSSNQSDAQLFLNEFCLSISYICDFVLINSRLKPHKSLLLKTLAFNKFFLVKLWRVVCSLSMRPAQIMQDLYLIQMLASTSCPDSYTDQLCRLIAPLSTFCSLYSLFLLPVLDEEFLRGEAIFSKADLIHISALLKNCCVGLVSLMHPQLEQSAIVSTATTSSSSDSKLNASASSLLHHHQHQQQQQQQQQQQRRNLEAVRRKAKAFAHLFQVCVQLVQRMYTRDIRFGFCPEEHWICATKFVASSRLVSIFQTQDASILTRVKFGQMSYLCQQHMGGGEDADDEDEDDGSGSALAGAVGSGDAGLVGSSSSTSGGGGGGQYADDTSEFNIGLNDIRAMTIIQELPFVIPFTERVGILENFIGSDLDGFYSMPSLKMRIRREYLYEDAYENMSPENAPALKSSRIQVEMISVLGLDEVGIDGGGVFREFMLTLLETGFDPNRGFFVLTSDGFLYPNPNIAMLIPNYHSHYYFLGRVLAKTVQCKLLSNIKFAGFFLQKCLSKYNDTRLDIDYLASLDPEIYKNLLYLKDYKGNVQDLDLNFALNSAQFGETQTVELKPGGKDILVTNENKIEYIHLVADYKLNKQIHEQVLAFRSGVDNIIQLDLLRLFNFNELQSLITGPDDTIDVKDWQKYTMYAGFYNADHVVIRNFWHIVESFSEEQKRLLLKFATSRSKPPLFGFQNLIPNFAIHSSMSQDRLPTASTCLNLLKLPPIENIQILRDKLICAIESDSGFELS